MLNTSHSPLRSTIAKNGSLLRSEKTDVSIPKEVTTTVTGFNRVWDYKTSACRPILLFMVCTPLLKAIFGDKLKKKIRHILKPNASFSLTPDFGIWNTDTGILILNRWSSGWRPHQNYFRRDFYPALRVEHRAEIQPTLILAWQPNRKLKKMIRIRQVTATKIISLIYTIFRWTVHTPIPTHAPVHHQC